MFPLLKRFEQKVPFSWLQFLPYVLIYNRMKLTAPPGFFLRVSLESPETPPCFPPGPRPGRGWLAQSWWPWWWAERWHHDLRPTGGKWWKVSAKNGWHEGTRPHPTKREHSTHTHIYYIFCIFIYYRYPSLLSSSISISRTSKTLQDSQPNPHQDHVDLHHARPRSQSSSFEPLDLTLKEKFIHLNCVPTRWASENQLEVWGYKL